MQMKLDRPALLALAVFAAALLPGTASADDMPEAAKTCADCHGDNGVSTNKDHPTIAGASAFFLENQLVIYQEKARPCVPELFKEAEKQPPEKDHCALAQSLSEDDVTALADYFSSQDFVPADQPVDEGLAGKGESIHAAKCDKCHTEGGSLALDDAGILAGQWKPYLLRQLEHFKAGKRWQPEKMEPEIKDLSEQDMKALVEYYASQGPKRFQ